MENFRLYADVDALLVDAALNSNYCKEGNFRGKGLKKGKVIPFCAVVRCQKNGNLDPGPVGSVFNRTLFFVA